MKIKNIICVLIFMEISFSITEIDLTDRIIIDGYSDDFMSDESILSDSLGNILESPSDSYWGEYIDIRQIKITWDESFLYLAVDACAWDNNVVLFIDIYNDYGIEDMSDISEWKRSFRFYNTISLLNIALSIDLYGLYLLGALGRAAKRAASS